jgi:hypothetical protein
MRLAQAIEEGTIILSNDFSRLQTAVNLVAANVLAVAEAIRNPAVDKNDQATIDSLAESLEAAAAALDVAREEENVEDGVVTEAPAE